MLLEQLADQPGQADILLGRQLAGADGGIVVEADSYILRAAKITRPSCIFELILTL